MDKIKEFKEITEEMAKLYAQKNTDYGDSFGKSFKEYGMIMPLIRIEDKINRLKTLTKSKTQKVNDESIADTLIDLANYSVMTLIELNSNKDDSK